TVWNGSSELAEIQMPATDSTPADTVENDTLAIARWRGTSVDPTYDANRLFGRVLYVDGLATDQPVFLTRVNYADASDVVGGVLSYAVYAPFSIYPLWNAQGRADRAVLGGGAEPGAPAGSLCVDGTARCAEVAFDRGLFPYARSGSDDGSWQGTLLVDKPNATGTYYRRNRNYDPNTARFTQEDPTGLAGGLNLYGFAAGDPVNFSDPSGLRACPPDCGSGSDWVSPTGKEVRGCDPRGCGAYGSSRDEGSRPHHGADYVADPGQPVVAVTSGTVVNNNGQVYKNPAKAGFRYIDIQRDDGTDVKEMYVASPNVRNGQKVQA